MPKLNKIYYFDVAPDNPLGLLEDDIYIGRSDNDLFAAWQAPENTMDTSIDFIVDADSLNIIYWDTMHNVARHKLCIDIVAGVYENRIVWEVVQNSNQSISNNHNVIVDPVAYDVVPAPISVDNAIKNNDGRDTCYFCGAATKRVDSIMKSYDICTACNR